MGKSRSRLNFVLFAVVIALLIAILALTALTFKDVNGNSEPSGPTEGNSSYKSWKICEIYENSWEFRKFSWNKFFFCQNSMKSHTTEKSLQWIPFYRRQPKSGQFSGF